MTLKLIGKTQRSGLTLTVTRKSIIINKNLQENMKGKAISNFMFCTDENTWGLIGVEGSKESYKFNANRYQSSVYRPNDLRHVENGVYCVEWNGEFYAVVEKIK